MADGVYTIEQGRPERMTATTRLSELLGEAIGARRDGRMNPSVLIELVAEATGTTTLETAEQLELAREIARRADARPNGSSSHRLAGPGRSSADSIIVWSTQPVPIGDASNR